MSYHDALAVYGIESTHPGGIALTKKILEDETINRKTKILDAGCGTGKTSAYLAKTFAYRVFSIDSHPEMLKQAVERFENNQLAVKVIKGSIERLPFLKNSFDYIIAESSIAFTNISKTLREFYRVLKPSGVLLSIDMVAEPSLRDNEKKEIMQFYQMKEILMEKEWMNRMKESGFKTVEVLKANNVLQEINQHVYDEENFTEGETFTELVATVNFDPEADKVIQKHQELLLAYGEKLSYGAFKASSRSTIL